jgi:hypothetical protein
MLETMPVSIEFMRGIAGFIGIGCAYMMGRSLVLFRQGRERQMRLYGWIFRTLLCMIGVGLRNPLDAADIVIWTLAAIAFGGALWNHSRPKVEEDFTSAMFPHDD